MHGGNERRKPFQRVNRAAKAVHYQYDTASEIAFLNGLGSHRPNKPRPSNHERLVLLQKKRSAYERRNRWDRINRLAVVTHCEKLIRELKAKMFDCARAGCDSPVAYEGASHCSVECAMIDGEYGKA